MGFGSSLRGLSFWTMMLIVLLLSSERSFASSRWVDGNSDLQAALSAAQPGDTIQVGPGVYEPFVVEKPLTVLGVGSPSISAKVQIPAVTIRSDRVNLSGFIINGVKADTVSKFDYYMEKYSRATPRSIPLQLNLPNVALLVEGDDVSLSDLQITGAEVGVLVEGFRGLLILNTTFQGCDRGARLLSCHLCQVQSSRFSGCLKAGLDAEASQALRIINNTANDTKHVGILLKNSTASILHRNQASRNSEGLALWNSSGCDLWGNEVSRNYYGILLADSDNNTVMENQAVDNTQDNIVAGFGVGISLQANSTHNVVESNLVSNSFNGVELTRGCELNAVVCNNISQNEHGVRLDKNQNNLLYKNNFQDNLISAYDNDTHNFWNTTVGNYYSDYHGEDLDGDGLGDEPYSIPKGSSEAYDYHPLMAPCRQRPDLEEVRRDLQNYARYSPQETLPFSWDGRTLVIEAKRPRSPPKFEETPKYGGSSMF